MIFTVSSYRVKPFFIKFALYRLDFYKTCEARK